MDIRYDGKLIRTSSAKTTAPIHKELVVEPLEPANLAECTCELCRTSRTENPILREYQQAV